MKYLHESYQSGLKTRCKGFAYNFRVADVALVSQARWDAGDPDDFLRGAPELVVEAIGGHEDGLPNDFQRPYEEDHVEHSPRPCAGISNHAGRL